MYPEQDGLPGARHRATDDEREEQRDPTQDPARERGQVGKIARVEDDRVRRPVVASARVVARPPEWVTAAICRTRSATLVRGLGSGVDPVHERLDATTPRTVDRRRRQSPGKPQVPEQDDEREDEGAEPESDGRRDPGPEDRVEPDAAIPEGVRPQVQPEAEQQEDADDGGHRDRETDPAAHPSRAPRASVVGTAGPAPAPATTAAAATVQDRGFLGVGGVVGVLVPVVVERRPLVAVVEGCGTIVAILERRGVVVVAVEWLRVSPRVGPGILPARHRLATAELLHEVVEQVPHPSASLLGQTVQGRWRPSIARATPVSTVSASSFGRIVA